MRVPFGDAEYQKVKALSLAEAYGVIDPATERAARQYTHQGYVRERVADVRVYPFVAEVLATARSAGVQIGAVTSHGETAEASLVQTGLYPYIDCEEVRRPKPHPEAILEVLRLFNVDRRHGGDRVFSVGDMPLDVEAGRAAGLRSIGVPTACRPKRRSAPPAPITSFIRSARCARSSTRPSLV